MSDVSAELAISASAIVKAVNDGRLVAYRFDSRWRFLREDVDAFIEASRVTPGTIKSASHGKAGKKRAPSGAAPKVSRISPRGHGTG